MTRRLMVWAGILLALVAVSCAARRGGEAWGRAIARVEAADSARAVAQRETVRAERRAATLARAASIDSARWRAAHDSVEQLRGRIRQDSIRFADGIAEAIGPRTKAYLAVLEREHLAAPIAVDAMALSRDAERAVAGAARAELRTADAQVSARDTAIAVARGGRCGMKCGAVLATAAVIALENAPRILRALLSPGRR